MQRIACQELNRILGGRSAYSAAPDRQITGRLLGVDGKEIVVSDGSGAVRLIAGDADEVQAGDIVRVTVHLDKAAIAGRRRSVIRKIERLTPWPGEGAYPKPQGECWHFGEGRPSRIEMLQRRAKGLAAIRRFFDERHYVEVQMPLRVRVPGLEPHLDAVPSGDAYLITSPEYHMKRLLVGGMERIYSLGPCFRRDEYGAHHLPEFHMLEWYCAYAELSELMAETEALFRLVADCVHQSPHLFRDGWAVDLRQPFTRLSVADAFERFAKVRLRGVVDTDTLRERAEMAGFGPFSNDTTFEEIFSRILVEKVEPALPALGAVLLHSYPAPLAALARLSPTDPTVAERFELYVAGIEVANAFAELTDPKEQLERFRGDQQARRQMRKEVYPVDRRFIDALAEGMPPSCGIALGVDRLMMIVCGAQRIEEVVAFGPEEI